MGNLLAFFGWQGGTIHQLEAETGVTSDVLLYAPNLCAAINDAYSLGASALQTCGLAWRRDTLAPKRKGDAAFWVGVACALHVCPDA